MARTGIPTYTTNQLITASHANTYWKDNEAAGWPYTTAGDLAVATSATVLGIIGAPTVGQVLGYLDGTWGAVRSGGINDFAMTSKTQDQNFTSGTYADITDATVTLALTVTSTVVLLAVVTGYADTTNVGWSFSIAGMIDGTIDSGALPFNGSHNPQRNEALFYIHAKENVPAGNRIVKLQCKNTGTNNVTTNFKLIAIAFTE
jgi:hypothetical protein